MTIMDRIEWNPRVCNGKPVIKGTRIPVSIILEQIGEGISWDQLILEYPELQTEDIKAAIFLARENIDNTDIRELNA